MTNSKRQVKIHVTSRRASVKIGTLIHAEGFSAIVIIAIIAAIKVLSGAARLTWAFVAWLAPVLFKLALRYAAGIYLAFRAFYTE